MHIKKIHIFDSKKSFRHHNPAWWPTLAFFVEYSSYICRWIGSADVIYISLEMTRNIPVHYFKED